MAEPEIILDLSRLLSRVLQPTPTGVDRVEMAYARGLLAAAPARLHFAAVTPLGLYGRLPRPTVEAFLDRIDDLWQHQGKLDSAIQSRHALYWLTRLRPRQSGVGSSANAVYVQPSPNNLTNPKRVTTILRRERAKLLCLVHDLIPIQYPEYARPGGAEIHARRIRTVVSQSSAILCNSQATLDALQPYLDTSGRDHETAVALLGVDSIASGPLRGSPNARPYFVCVGTVEPRKNHLLLLHLWRSMAERANGQAIPILHIIGRRGWENEQVVDLLERCPALSGCVREHAGLPDREMWELLRGARALLLPSFAEGYGMPVTEALAMGVPVVCSDLSALREAGGGVPEYIDPLDGPAWERAIVDLSSTPSAIRAGQLERLEGWKRPCWTEHIAILLDLIHRGTR